jgi:hypothetical protein
MTSRYDLYQDALIDSYTGDSTGIPLGAHYQDVLRWLPAMRPWPAADYAATYTITHLVYTLNSYSQFRVPPDCFPAEFAYLKATLPTAIAERDPETMGEFLDSLRAFGLGYNDSLIRAGFDYLLGAQNADGSWGDPGDPSSYGRYHPTWTAIDGLRDYRWSRTIPCVEPHPPQRLNRKEE